MATWTPNVDLDKEDPANERDRLALNQKERDIIKREMQYKQVIRELTTTERTIDDILGDIDLDRLPLTRAVTTNAYPPLRQAFILVAVQMYLRFDEGIKRKDIQERLSLSTDQIEKLIASDDFKDEYNKHFLELRSHPVIQAVQGKIVEDLLPEAYQVFDQILRNKKAPASVRLKAAMEVMDKAGVKALDPQTSNRRELADYLGKNQVHIENVNVNVPVPDEYASYQEKLDQSIQQANLDDADQTEIIDGEFAEDHQPVAEEEISDE